MAAVRAKDAKRGIDRHSAQAAQALPTCQKLIPARWLVPARRLAMVAFLGLWLAAPIYQTADIGLGYGVSPPQTVTQFPRVIGYVVVTAVILALGLS